MTPYWTKYSHLTIDQFLDQLEDQEAKVFLQGHLGQIQELKDELEDTSRWAESLDNKVADLEDELREVKDLLHKESCKNKILRQENKTLNSR